MKTTYSNFKGLAYALAFCLMAVVPMLTACSDEDEYTSRGDLFQPRFINEPVCTVDSNNAAIAWYQVNDAVGYTVQLYTDNYYTNLFCEYTVSTPYIDIQDVPFASTFYVRVRSNAADSAHNSRWATTSFTSLKRGAYAQLLQDVSKTEITETGATIRWTVDPSNPVDSISIVPLMDKTLASVCRYLTAEEQAAGAVTVEGLTPNSLYTVNVYDTSKPRTYDKPYNQVNFRTAGPAAQSIEVGLLDDLSAMLAENNEDPDIPEGTEYYLKAGTTYNISAFEIKKGFRIVGGTGGDKPVVVINGSFRFATDAYVQSIELQNIEVRNAAVNQYFFNCGNPYTLELASFVNVTFRNINRGFWRHQATNLKHIMSFEMEGCWIDQCGWQTGCYGMFAFGSAGKNNVASLDVIDNLSMKNCTFSRGGYKQNETWGWGNIINHNSSDAPINLTLQNVTIYDYCVNNRLIDISNAVGSTLTIKNVLLASPSGELFRAAAGTTTEFSGNYTTTDYVLGGAKMQATDLSVSAAELFQDPDNGDYTIKDKASEVYKNRAGDTRWLK